MSLGDIAKKLLVGDVDTIELPKRVEVAGLMREAEIKTRSLDVIEDELSSVIGEMNEERSKLQLIFDTMPQCIYVSDLVTGVVYYANPSVKIAHCDGIPIEGKICYRVFHGRNEPCDSCNNSRLIAGETPIRREHYNKKNNKYYQIIDSVIDWPGVGKARLEVATDITTQKNIEHTLQRQRYKFEALAAASFEAIAIHRDNRLITANRAFLELCGYSEAELAEMSDLISVLFGEHQASIRTRVEKEDRSIYKTTLINKSGDAIEVVIKPNYVQYNHSGDCRVAAIVTHEFTEERAI